MNKILPLALFKPTGSRSGHASQWNLAYFPDNKYDKWVFFVSLAKQGEKNEKGNPTFDWDKSIKVKLGEPDISEILAVLYGLKSSAGYKDALYHQSPDGGSKVIKFVANDTGYHFSISAKSADKEDVGYGGHGISLAEGILIKLYLENSLKHMYGFGL